MIIRHSCTRGSFIYPLGFLLQDGKRLLRIINKYRTDKGAKRYLYKCMKCTYEGDALEEKLKSGQGCACCNSKIVLEGINDIPTTAPWMVKFFLNGKEEAKKYTCSSEKRVFMKCPYCGRVSDRKLIIGNLHRIKRFGCLCSDKIPYTEKFMLNLLENLGVVFEKEKGFPWLKINENSKRFDFYIPSLGLIIEMDGIQHFNSKNPWYTEERASEDFQKDFLAREHGLEVIRINCSESSFSFIKKGVEESHLNRIFDLSNVDWDQINRKSCNNLVKEVCVFYEKGFRDTNYLSEKFKISRATIISYLKRGAELGWTNYSTKYSFLQRGKIIARTKLLKKELK